MGEVVPLVACQLPNPMLQRRAWRDLPPVQLLKLWRRVPMRFQRLSKKLETLLKTIWKMQHVIFMPCFRNMGWPYPYRLVLWSVGYSMCTTSPWLPGSDIYWMISHICFWIQRWWSESYSAVEIFLGIISCCQWRPLGVLSTWSQPTEMCAILLALGWRDQSSQISNPGIQPTICVGMGNQVRVWETFCIRV